MNTNTNFKRQVYNEVKRRGLIPEQELENNTGGFKEIISVLFHSRTQVHVFHLQTESYAEHKALQDYYEGVLELIDGLVESYQGKYGIITNYTTLKVDDYINNDDVKSYLEKVNSVIEKNRTSVKESFMQNQIDTVQELIFSTLYKLKFLK
jgi:hypothetical protein